MPLRPVTLRPRVSDGFALFLRRHFLWEEAQTSKLQSGVADLTACISPEISKRTLLSRHEERHTYAYGVRLPMQQRCVRSGHIQVRRTRGSIPRCRRAPLVVKCRAGLCCQACATRRDDETGCGRSHSATAFEWTFGRIPTYTATIDVDYSPVGREQSRYHLV